jgi:hypothetical protein
MQLHNMIEEKILERSIIKTLLYYAIFNYPLNANEVYRFLPTNSVSQDIVSKQLNSLTSNRLIYQFDELFSVQPKQQLAIRRQKGNILAEKYFKIARKRAKLIANFPFVRGVFVSGSLSKGYMDDKSDLDFFIITTPGRLWIARTFIAMFKRVFFFNSHKYFCCNYFIDYDHLEIGEKNLFTATELATLIPLYGHRIYHRMLAENEWLFKFFPNYKPKKTDTTDEISPRMLKGALENFLKYKLWDRAEKYFMKITLRRWRRLYEDKYHADDFNIAFTTNEHVSKNHPNHFQKKVMKSFDEKLKNYDQQFHINLVSP